MNRRAASELLTRASANEGQLPNAVLLRMRQAAPLSLGEFELLQTLPKTARSYPAQTELCLAGQVQSPLLLLSGWACYQCILGDGRRQITRFILPGDPIGSLVSLTLPVPSAAMALTPVVVADARAVLRAVDENGAPYPSLSRAIVQMSHTDEINMGHQVVRLGRQTAYERLVHLFLELYSRLHIVGLADKYSFSLPLTQEVLADALDMSVVHVNRTLQQIRRDKLLDMRNGEVILYQPDRMQTVTDWATPLAARLSQHNQEHTAAIGTFHADLSSILHWS